MDAPTLLDVPGLIRRVRRRADLSQRDLAAVLGVDQSLVARWETGALAPSLAAFQRVLDLGGFRLAVIDDGAAAAESAPMRADGVRDRQRRRFPSHLDVHDRVDVMTGNRRPSAPWRRRRDRLRELAGAVPFDHPTHAELVEAQRNAAERRRAVLVQRVRALREWTPLPAVPCTCPTACWLAPHCDDGCPCACEPSLGAARWQQMVCWAEA